MARNQDKRARRGALPMMALFLGWTFATAVLIGVGATYYQQTGDQRYFIAWVAPAGVLLVLLVLLGMFNGLTRPKRAKADASPAPRAAGRRQTTFGRR